MNTLNTSKKPASRDWHKADIQAALYKAGWTFRRLARHHGVSPGAITHALREPRPLAEARIAAAIGIEPYRIWPSRYHPDGSPKSGRGERGIGRRTTDQSSGVAAICNVDNT